MNNYIQLRISGGSTYKKCRVMYSQDTPVPYVSAQGRDIKRTLSGKISKQSGIGYKAWRGYFRIYVTEETGYAGISDYTTWMTSSTPANQILDMIDWDSGSHTVTFTGDMTPYLSGPYPGVNSYYLLPFEMETT